MPKPCSRDSGTCTYDGRGFDKLAKLRDEFDGSSESEIAYEMFQFFQGFNQGADSTLVYLGNIRKKFDRFANSKDALSKMLQIMLTLRGLQPRYHGLFDKFKTSAITFDTVSIGDIKDWCKEFDNPSYTPVHDGPTNAPPSARPGARIDNDGDGGSGGGDGGGGGRGGAGGDRGGRGGGGRRGDT